MFMALKVRSAKVYYVIILIEIQYNVSIYRLIEINEYLSNAKTGEY